MSQRNYVALKALGRLGGINAQRKRAKKKAQDAQIAALERGTIAPPAKPKKKRPSITWRRVQELRAWVANPANYEDECWLRDESTHLHLCPID